MTWYKLVKILAISVILASTISLTVSANDKKQLAQEVIIGVDDINTQLDNLYTNISEKLNINREYVQVINSIFSNKYNYNTITPDIYNDEMLNTCLNIDKSIEYEKIDWVEDFDRDSSKYIPDSLYTITKEISRLMQNHYDKDSGYERFNSLFEEVKTQITFYEAIIEFYNEDIIYFSDTYFELIATKNNNENIVKVNDNGDLEIKEEFIQIFINNNMTSDDIDIIKIILASDKYLAENSNLMDIQTYIVEPFNLNETTQENMIKAASSIVGKVRYIWGGGHDETSNIDGINPAWLEFDKAYGDSDGSIRPAGTYCISHGSFSSLCTRGRTVRSIDDYISLNNDVFNTRMLNTDKYRDLIKNIGIERGIESHRLDGLDCSGFVSWIYNQITDKRHYNAVAREYVQSMGLKEIPLGEKLESGDVFAWMTHIIMIVAPYNSKGQVYLGVESTPDIIRYCVAYYSGASQSDIDTTIELASELNQLIGGLEYSNDTVKCYCMSTIGRYEITDEEIDQNEESKNIDENEAETKEEIKTEEDNNISTNDSDKSLDEEENEIDEEQEVIEEIDGIKYGKFSIIGRYPNKFDETYIGENEKFSDLYAIDMMQYIVDNMSLEWLEGYKIYSNDDNKLIKSNNVRM